MSKPSYEELEAQVKRLTIDAGCYKRGMEASNERLWQLAEENSIMRKLLPDYISVPATDNFLASLRAEGVEMFASDIGSVYQQLRQGSAQANALKGVVFRAASFAAQLRSQSEQVKGVQS